MMNTFLYDTYPGSNVAGVPSIRHLKDVKNSTFYSVQPKNKEEGPECFAWVNSLYIECLAGTSLI